MMTIEIGEGMTMAVTRKIKGVNMTAAAVCNAGVMIGVMTTGDEFMSSRGSSMHRLHRRASVSFSHRFSFVPKRIASRRLPSVQAELIWAAVASQVGRVEQSETRQIKNKLFYTGRYAACELIVHA